MKNGEDVAGDLLALRIGVEAVVAQVLFRLRQRVEAAVDVDDMARARGRAEMANAPV